MGIWVIVNAYVKCDLDVLHESQILALLLLCRLQYNIFVKQKKAYKYEVSVELCALHRKVIF